MADKKRVKRTMAYWIKLTLFCGAISILVYYLFPDSKYYLVGAILFLLFALRLVGVSFFPKRKKNPTKKPTENNNPEESETTKEPSTEIKTTEEPTTESETTEIPKDVPRHKHFWDIKLNLFLNGGRNRMKKTSRNANPDIDKESKRRNENLPREDKYFRFRKYFWLLQITISFAISGFAIILFPGTYYFLGGLIYFLIIALATMKLGWRDVPQNHAWMIEIFGDFVYVWHGGLHILIPWFGFMKHTVELYLGEQIMHLNMDESVEEDYGFGVVDFIDGSAPVVANVFFIITEPNKAAYAVDNVISGIEEKMDSAIRSYLGGYKIDQANRLKVHMNLDNILNGESIDELALKPKVSLDDEENRPEIWKQIHKDWGVKIKSITISDIVLSDSIIKTRESILIAEKQKEAAVHQAETKEILAKGEKIKLTLEGDGLADQVKKLTDIGILGPDAVTYLRDRVKWESISKTGNKTLIIDSGSNSSASAGSQFAAGMASVNQDNTAAKKEYAQAVGDETAEAEDDNQ